MKSSYSLFLVSLLWFFLGAFYYPKWSKPGSEAAISWDVSGYYHYLPAIFIYKDLKNLSDKESAQQLVSFLWWATHDGQTYAAELGYAPLAPEVRVKVEQALKIVTYKGAPLKAGR